MFSSDTHDIRDRSHLLKIEKRNQDLFVFGEGGTPGMSVATASHAEVVGFGPLDKVLEAEYRLGNECPFRSIRDTLAPIAEVFIPMYLWTFR